jgi:hypothetical protein
MTADINRPSDKVASAKLKSIYDEMRSRQLKAIEKAGTLRSDQFFVPDAKVAGEGFVPSDAISGEGDVDDRRCLAISAIVDSSVRSSWTGAFRELQRRLKEEVGQYGLIFSQDPPVVGGGQLHWTLMQLVGFPDYDVEVDQPENSVYLSSEYMDCVQDSLTVGGLDAAIHIQYVGVIVVATGLLMVGIPSLDINEARDSVRSRLADGRLPLKEPFVNDIIHSTLYRVAGDPADMPVDLHHKLIKLAKEFENVTLGSVILEKLQIGPASWRVLKSEMECTPALRKWELPVETPSEKYNAKILSEEGGTGRECYTVSGASGANLAKELRQVIRKQRSHSINIEDPVLDAAIGDGKKSAVSERIGAFDLRKNAPHVPQASADQVSAYEEDYARDNMATLTGAGGIALAQELQKKLAEEQRALDNLFYTDFY